MKKHVIISACISLVFLFSGGAQGQTWNPNHKIGTLTGVYNYTYNQVPAQLVEVFPASLTTAGLSYQWEQSSMPLSGFTAISGATQANYAPTSPLAATTYFRRKTSGVSCQCDPIYSNVIKLTVVSVNWEDINYLREHAVKTTGITSWTSVDQLAIGPKLQSTVYLDGLGRSMQSVSRETATPPSGTGLWGDMVQFEQYDVYGRQPKEYLPYTTTSQSGKFKTSPLTEQPQYYAVNYNEQFAYSTITFDNSPLDIVKNIKKPGLVWASTAGNSAEYDFNYFEDNIPRYVTDYINGNIPVYVGTYQDKTLLKSIITDEYGKKVVEYTDKFGRLILKKVQLDDIPASAYNGWICTYNIYDDYGLLRCQIQPEGMKYLEANSWSFAGVNGQAILNEQCFQYGYDERGRMTWKKNPGSAPMQMLYDSRNRIVFTQDGNQSALSTPQWTTSIYDELDRVILTTLYNTTRTAAQLQADINAAPYSSTITIANPGTASVTAVTNFNPIPAASLNNAAICTVVGYSFYDSYAFSSVKPFTTTYTNTSAYNTSDPNVIAINRSWRTINMPTGSMRRVLGTTQFLKTTLFYDERGALVQVNDDNIKGGQDIATLQYHFDGRLLSSCSDHTTPGTNYTNYKILSMNNFDKLGRVVSVAKQFGTNAMKILVEYAYDDMGRIKKKRLDPGYTAGGNAELESLEFSYNLHNQLTGINKDFALKNPSSYNKWGHFFGLYLGFDNRDNLFAASNLNGQVAGVIWNTQGDDAQRKYDYTYDNAGRLSNAFFKEKQHTADAWDNSKLDYTVTGSGGKIEYDLNGNLIKMMHKGVLPGTPNPIVVDNLSYSYSQFSNKLQSVADGMINTAVNGKFGDFKDGSNGTTPDYVYDNNGNVVVDLNKNSKELAGVAGANGIKYNYLDKPEQIRIAGKGTIQIIYSSSGEKLQRIFTPEPSGAAVTTTYIRQFTYQQVTAGALTLQSISFEEGRIREITPTAQDNGLDAIVVDGNMDLPGAKRGAYDFYITDYLGNVRMILSEEIHVAKNTATMELTRAGLEESIFGQAGTGNEVAATRYAKPSAWTNADIGAKVSRLGINAGRPIGPNTLQKVMAGDKITASVLYYHAGSAGGNSTTMVSSVLGSLVQAIGGGSAVGSLVKDNASAVTGQLSGVGGFVTAVQPGGSAPSGTTPQAYLTVLFFDERFNFVAATDGGVAQQQVAASVGSNGAQLVLPNIKAPKNGYAYVYVSNQSNNDVFFDNLSVAVSQSNISEENHYYAFGLKIATLSSRKLGDSYEGSLKNNFLYQGVFSELDDDIGWTDFSLRNYDGQIGRWIQQDPYQEFPSPYQSMACDPISQIDPTGGISIPGLGGLSTTAEKAITLGEVILTSTRRSVQAVAGFSKVVTITISVTTVAISTCNLVNSSMQTSRIGDLALISARGTTDAMWNAHTLGVHDLINGTNLSDYSDPEEQKAYLTGRLIGDAAAIAWGATVASTGASGGASLALVTGGTSALVGGAAATYAAGVGAAATSDLAWATWKLAQITGLLDAGIGTTMMAANSKKFGDFVNSSASNKTGSSPGRGTPATRSHSRKNFRYNLSQLLGEPSVSSHAHHIFPLKFKLEFLNQGINVNNPSYGAWWEAKSHLQNAGAYNEAWKKFLSLDPSKSEIMNFGKKIMRDYGFHL